MSAGRLIDTSTAAPRTISMSNSTTTDRNLTLLLLTEERIFNIAVPTVLAINIYLFLCVVIFGTKKRKWTAASESRNIYITSFVVVALGIPCCSTQILVIKQSKDTDEGRCEMTSDIAAVATFLAVYSIHGFLWHRQFIINSFSVVQSFTPKYVRILSWCNLLTIIGFLLYMIIRDSILDTRDRCLPVHIGFNLSFIMLGYGIFSQVTFSVQFLYPMIKIHRIKMSDDAHDCIFNLIRRCLTASLVIIFTDVVLILVLAFRPHTLMSMANSYMTVDIDIVVNQFAMLLTFKDFLDILISPFCFWRCHPAGTESRVNDVSMGELAKAKRSKLGIDSC